VSRLSRFEDYRFIGTRDTMRFYDSDDPDQFEQLSQRVDGEELVERKLIQSFAPDTVDEARNRGFKPVRATVPD
jgi:hypothetical protein